MDVMDKRSVVCRYLNCQHLGLPKSSRWRPCPWRRGGHRQLSPSALRCPLQQSALRHPRLALSLFF
eukprot:1396822-Pleurochrysis_carterae.AAC.1